MSEANVCGIEHFRERVGQYTYQPSCGREGGGGGYNLPHSVMCNALHWVGKVISPSVCLSLQPYQFRVGGEELREGRCVAQLVVRHVEDDHVLVHDEGFQDRVEQAGWELVVAQE